jgi:Family of unknown function (DUF5343)
MAKESVRPPYVSQADLAVFMQRVKDMGPPAALDKKWVESYGMSGSQPHALIGTLKWLGVLDHAGNVNKDQWKALRTSQVETLAGMVRTSYKAIFDAIDPATADKAMITGAFINEYDSGDPGRPVGSFIALCELAGIRESSGRRSQSHAAPAATKKAAAVTKKAQVRPSPPLKKDLPQDGQSAFSVALSVEIPASWDEAKVEERLRMIATVIRRVSTS